MDEKYDVACGEAGRIAKGNQKDTKVLVESGIKTPKVAHDIMMHMKVEDEMYVVQLSTVS